MVAGIYSIALDQTNTILGFLIGFLTVMGWNLFKGRKGVLQLVVCILCLVLAVVLSEAIYYVGIIEKDYAESLALLKQMGITESSSFYITRENAYNLYLQDPAFWEVVRKDLSQTALYVGATGLIAIFITYFRTKKETAQPTTNNFADANVPTDDVTAAQVPNRRTDDTINY